MPSQASANPPLIWWLRSHRAGENSQLRALAEALTAASGGTLVDCTPDWGRLANAAGVLRLASLSGLSARGRRQVQELAAEQPPDLVIGAGLRSEPVARWLADRHGARLVFLGRVWAALRHVHLLVTTPQYRLPDAANIQHNPTTLHSFTAAQLAHLRAAPRPADLPGPVTTVLIGGDAGPYALRSGAARALLRQALDLAGDGQLLVTTSARTHPDAVAVLRDGLSPPHRLHTWADNGENPYAQWLAWADRLLVSADSIAMLSEAVAAERPVHLFDPLANSPPDSTAASLLYRALLRFGPARLGRDVGLVHRDLAARGWLHLPDQTTTPTMALGGPRSALDATVRRALDLLEQPGSDLSAAAGAAAPGR